MDFERGMVFTDEKQKRSQEHREYLKKHPEVGEILTDFVADVLAKQPEDIASFAKAHFGSLSGTTTTTTKKEKAAAGQQQQQQQLRPIVVMGPSGVGKGTVIKKMMEREPDAFGFSVSHTTRKARGGERDGVEYHFVSRGEMEEMERRGEFLEHAEVHGNMYGTSRGAVKAVTGAGKICVLDIDVQGGRQLRRSGADCVFVFIDPPSMTELETRLRGRGTETEDSIQVRMRNAKAEIEESYSPGFVDFRVVNDKLEDCVQGILDAIAPELLRRRQFVSSTSTSTSSSSSSSSSTKV